MDDQGKAKIEFPISVLRQRYSEQLAPHTITFTANVTESLTGITLIGSATVTFYREPVQVEFLPSNPKNFKPGLDYIAFVKISQPDGLPVPTSADEKVTVHTTVQSVDITCDLQYIFINIDLDPLSIPLPIDGLVTASYKGVTANTTVTKSYSPSDSYMQVFLRSTDTLRVAGSVMAGGVTSYRFSLPVQPAMAPSARLVLYYVRQDGEVITDSMSFAVDGAFENEVTVKMDHAEAEPGDSVQVTVSATPQSTAYLLAVDQSVLLKKSGNDITADQVFDELKNYDTIVSPRSPITTIYYGGRDATQIFENAGVAVMSDSLVYKYQYTCSDVADIVFVLDSSGSIGSYNFQTLKHFVQQLVGSFHIGKSNVRVGVLRFDSNANPIIHLNTYYDNATIVNTIGSISYPGGGTDTARALDTLVNTMFTASHGDRTGVPNVGVVITDGASNSPYDTANAAARARDAGITLLALGIGSGVNYGELNAIATDPDKDNVFTVSGFSSLDQIRETFQKAICEAAGYRWYLKPRTDCPTSPPTTTTTPAPTRRPTTPAFMTTSSLQFFTPMYTTTVRYYPGLGAMPGAGAGFVAPPGLTPAPGWYITAAPVPYMPTALPAMTATYAPHAPLTTPVATIGPIQDVAEVESVRSIFPATWLWTNSSIGADGTATVTATMPDSITSWVASAFAVSSSTGFGVARDTATVRVFRPFFVSLNLPYSVIRGEHVVLQAIVFNYMQQDQDVRVTLAQSQDFYNLEVDAGGQEDLRREDKQINVHVPSGQGKSVYFPIVPTTVGHVELIVSAQTQQAADAVRRNLKVEAEGVPKEYNVGVLLDLKNTTSFSRDVNLTLPPNVVSDSELLRVTAIGDVMSPSINGLDSLLRMPTGCGEQNMLGMAPDVFVTRYLTATNQLTEDIADTAVSFMEHGYQTELTYQHMDGSFSIWGDRDPSGSTWYSTMTMMMMMTMMTTTTTTTMKMMMMMMSRLTAFVAKTFQQAEPYIQIDVEVIARAVDWLVARQNYDGSFPEYGIVHDRLLQGARQRVRDAQVKAVDYLKQQLPSITDNYVLAIVSYALALAGDPASTSALARLESKAVVEGTADTIIALQALSEFAPLANSGDSLDVEVDVTAGSFTPHFTVTKGNALVLQSAEVDVFFNVEAEVEEPAFELHVNLTKDTLNLLEMETCARWLAAGSSGMAVQEVGIPSGFEVDTESLLGPYTLKRKETENSKLVLYFDEISGIPTCVRMSMLRTRMVAKSKPVAVRVYDYYEPGTQVRPVPVRHHDVGTVTANKESDSSPSS
nr:hypothetical protein BaRGS_008902 [Batillaria attramentaria]